jgi:peptide/nickel transport system permease protein
VGLDTWRHYILPVVTIALGSSAGLLRLTRTTMLETIRQDYIRTARAKGCAEGVVIWKHALKNACLPIITTLGFRFGFVLGGTIVIESVFGIPGVGFYVLNSINNRDIPVVVSSTLLISACFCLIMVVVDICYAVVDPRVRARFSR